MGIDEKPVVRRDVVTFDGLAASGKSTIAKALANELGTVLLSTGEAHRINVFKIQREGVEYDDEKILGSYLDELKVEWSVKENRIVFSIGGLTIEDVRKSGMDVRMIPLVTRKPPVCNKFTEIFRSITYHTPIIADGHGLGNGIFHDARMKFFCEASAKVRAQRRARQLGMDLEKVLAEINERDASDMSREINPVKKSPDMIIIDTEKSSIESCLSQAKAAIRQYGILDSMHRNISL
jgi:CMP/dCMP kinase